MAAPTMPVPSAIDVPRPLDAVGHAESLEQSPVKLGCEEFQDVLVVRVPGFEAANDECVHCDRAGPSHLQNRLQILVLVLFPLPGFFEGVLSVLKWNCDVYDEYLGPLPDHQIWSLSPVSWRGSRDRLILEQEFASSLWVPYGRLDPPENVIVPLRHVCHCPVAVVEDVAEALEFPVASTASLVFHPLFNADGKEVGG